MRVLGVGELTRVVIIRPDLRANIRSIESRPNITLDQLGRLVRRHIHGRKPSITIQRLILYRQIINVDTLIRKALDIVDKILRILARIVHVEIVVCCVSRDDTIEFHPPWW